MDEAHAIARHAVVDELVAQLVVGVPRLAGRAEVAEDDLQRARARRRFAARGVAVGAVAVLVPDVAIRAAATSSLLGVDDGSPVDHAHVQRGLAAVGGDLEHVVFLGRDALGADGLGALAELGDVGGDLRGRLDQDRLGQPLAVGARPQHRRRAG